MKILIATNHFYPETFRVNDLAFHLAEKGHAVTVLTAIPDYPKGKFFKGYGIFLRRKETIRGVRVIRSLVIPRGRGGKVRLALNYFSMSCSSTFNACWLALFHRFDAVVVHETSPVMIGIPAVLVKWMRKSKMIFWVLDLWPESLKAAGGINNKRVLGFFDRLTRWLYRHSDSVLISSKGFEQSVVSKDVSREKIHYFPNWGEDLYLNVPPLEKILPELPQGFRIMFAGNIGEAQNFEQVIRVAERTPEQVKWILIGDGRKREWIEKAIRQLHLEKRVFLMGNYPMEMMPHFFRQADALFLSLKDNEVFRLTLPAKIQAYMASAKPILAMANGEIAQLLADARCGYCVGPNDVEGMCAVIDKIILQPQLFAQMGIAGQHFFVEHFMREKCLARFDDFLKQ